MASSRWQLAKCDAGGRSRVAPVAASDRCGAKADLHRGQPHVSLELAGVLDSSVGRALCERHGLTSQIEHDVRHIRLSGKLTRRSTGTASAH